MASLSPPATYTLKTPKPSCYKSTSTVTRSSLTDHSDTPVLAAKRHLLRLIADQDRGLKTQSNPKKLAEIIGAMDSLAAIGRGTVTTDETLSATWRMLWTTEKEQLFIIKNARVFGTAAGDVLQVIDTAGKSLNNVITFPPDGVFFVRSDIQIASPQRVNFQFTSAVLRGKGWEFPLPPFGQGWFESYYMDDEIRVVKDISPQSKMASALKSTILRHVRVPIGGTLNFNYSRLTAIRSMSSHDDDHLDKQQVVDRVLDIVKSFPKVDPSKVTPDVHFQKDLGLDSLDTVEIVMAIEEEFKLEIPDKEADKIDSCSLAIEYVYSHPMAS